MSQPNNMEVLALTIPEAGRLLKLGRGAAYAAAARGDIPTVTYGRCKRVPIKLLQNMLDQPKKTEAA